MAVSASSAAVIRNPEWRAEERALTRLLSDETFKKVMRRISTRELLTSFAFVCRRWRRLCKSFAVYELVPKPFSPTADPWRELPPNPYIPSGDPWPHMTRENFMRLASVHASTIEKLNLRRFWQLKSEHIIYLCQSLPQLRDLSIAPRTPPRSPQELHVRPVIELIASHLPSQLVSLDIHVDEFTATFLDFGLAYVVDDNMLRRLYQRCPNLQKLNLCTSTITPHGLNGLLEACKTLTSLDLQSPELGWPEVAKVFTSCRSLCHFSLESKKFTPRPWSRAFEDAQDRIKFFEPRTKAQEEMDRCFDERGRRKGARDVGQDGVFYTSEGVSLGRLMPKHLTSLRIYDDQDCAANFELSPMEEILRSSGSQLRQLHAQGVYNTNWQNISAWCGNLKLLDLTHEQSMSLTQIEERVICGLIRSLKKLERVALPSAKDRILTDLGKFCQNLTEIRIQAYYNSDHQTEFKKVTDKGVTALAERCPALRVLSLSGCPNLTIASARALALHCRQLQVLMLNGCSKFRSPAVAALLPRLSRSLIFLDIVGCMITRATLREIEKYNGVTTLRVVAISSTLWDKADEEGEIADMHECNPLLEIRRGSGRLWTGFYHEDRF